jgi:phospholipid/cholesterol/gamma-HCH transport system substrate-binding protein
VNPYVVGLASILFIGAFVGLAFMVGILHLFEKTYTVTAVFPDAAGLKSGDEVRVAGVKSGRVTGISPDRVEGTVIVEMVVNDGVELGEEPTAEIALATLLGSKYIDIGGKVQGTPFAELPEEERVIPLERTTSPFDIFELTRIGTEAIEATDNEKLNTFINDLADVTEGQRENVTELVTGLDTVATAINEREAQLRSLLDRADELTATLAEKDETLVALIDQSRGILELIADRRDDVAAGIANGNAAVGELARLLEVNQSTLQGIIDSLGPTIDVVDRRQADLNRTLAIAGPGFLGQAMAGSHGPWADIDVRALGPDVIQVLSDAFSQLPGPDQPAGAAP